MTIKQLFVSKATGKERKKNGRAARMQMSRGMRQNFSWGGGAQLDHGDAGAHAVVYMRWRGFSRASAHLAVTTFSLGIGKQLL